MVGIVIVSHSKKLAEGVKELAEQMSQGKVKIFAAGGLNDETNSIGTDPFLIKEAIELADSDGGVLVLMDIGSAVMNAEMATELLSENLKEKVLLCEAPLVEGAIAAAAQAMSGFKLEKVAMEARNGLLGKATLLGAAPPTGLDGHSEVETTGREIKIEVPNKLGLHARPSVRLVELVNRFDNEVSVAVNNGSFVSATSISQVGTLGAMQGDTLVFKVRGNEFSELERTLKEFSSNNFGDSKELKTPKATTEKVEISTISNLVKGGAILGIGVSKGIAIAPAKVLRNDNITVEKTEIVNTIEEIGKLKGAISKVLNEVEVIQHKTMVLFGQEDAEIFNFHLLLLNDKDQISEVENLIEKDHYSAAYSWYKVFTGLEQKYLKIDDIYLRERAADVVEIRNKVVDELLDSKQMVLILDEPSILVVDEIGPAQTLSLDTSKVLGIVSQIGGETSHATILARSLGIPAITGLNGKIDAIKDNFIIAIDGSTGEIWSEKDHPEMIVKLKAKKEVEEEIKKERFSKAKLAANSLDGETFKVLANISSPKEAKIAYDNGADGIGLYRTEFLYMNQETPPTEEVQYAVYKEVCENMNGLPITIRTLDVGGDKPIPYLGIPHEDNPFLGLRGIRYCLQNQEIFKTQLRALCRISADYDIGIMYPMVGMVEEVLEANALLEEVREDLKKDGIPFSDDMKVGIMVEVPSVAFILPLLAEELDFISIGTNDLTQYLLAMDRENSSISKHYSALHPAVLSALKVILDEANRLELEVSLCGELAMNTQAANLLSALGLRRFSMSGPAIPRMKDTIRNMNVGQIMHLYKKLDTWRTLDSVKSALNI
ncbi:phosphoenolpyruvate--protein phosphotransferase [Maribacter sp. IgM3_T14_3]|uniref:phosphoenolpyruvate--protein phosphotransferase n=1 Tax=Maribacter sp. IgM3_T14_3 TaxID=3415140 RepID=UPI003C6EFD64